MSATNICQAFSRRAEAGGSAPAMHVPCAGVYRTLTWNELAADVDRAAAHLAAWGVKQGDRVLLVSPNRYEWIVTDLAIQACRAVHVPVHAALSGPQIAYQIADSGARAVLLAGEEHAERLRPLAATLPQGIRWLAFDPAGPIGNSTPVTWNDALAQADQAAGTRLRTTAGESARDGDLATILYTSGTTGEPKGVMLSQQNIMSNARTCLECWDHAPDDLRLTWLPLSHIFARTCDLYTWIISGMQLALAEAPDRVIANCAAWKPTHLNGVPYFWEKVQNALVDSGRANQPGALAQMFGGRLRVCISGGAPLPRHVEQFYQDRGVLLVQGYGLTETSPVISTGTPAHHRIGTVGPPIAGVDVRIADDGEILTRGPHVMLGYWNKPEATAEAIRDGWFHTGDVGELDGHGYLSITGRKKELIVTSGGKNIAPAHLEALLTADPLIEQAVVVGDARKYLAALIVPNPTALRAEIVQRGIVVTSPAEALVHADVRALYAERIRERLAQVSRYEQVQEFVLLDRALSIDRGELTPTLKLRRAAICANFADQIEAMYAK